MPVHHKKMEHRIYHLGQRQGQMMGRQGADVRMLAEKCFQIAGATLHGRIVAMVHEPGTEILPQGPIDCRSCIFEQVVMDNHMTDYPILLKSLPQKNHHPEFPYSIPARAKPSEPQREHCTSAEAFTGKLSLLTEASLSPQFRSATEGQARQSPCAERLVKAPTHAIL